MNTNPTGNTMMSTFTLRHLAALLVAFTPLVVNAQVQIGALSRGSNAVTLAWQGGYGPYLVRTSANLLDWSDQGEPADGTNRNLSAFADRSFYAVSDLNASNLYGNLFGLIQTDQGEFGGLMARHRLKTRMWLYKTKGAPHTSATYRATNYWSKLRVNLQTHWNGEVQTWTGPLENLGRMTTPGNANNMTITWTNGTGSAQRIFTLAFDFLYRVSDVRNNSDSTAPNASDPDMTLRCTYATPQPELGWDWETVGFTNITLDEAWLVQMDPGNPTNLYPEARNYRVSDNGAEVHLHFREGLPLYQGEPPFIFKTYLLDRWLSPTTAGGGSLPAFSTDSYFSRTLQPGHHNFFEIVLIEPALDPALSEATRRALAAANIRYIYTFKDLDSGMNPDVIRYFGFDNTSRNP
jgi:hypothetical protein